MKKMYLSTHFLKVALLVVSLCIVGCGEKGEDKTSPVTPPTPSTPETPTPQSSSQTIPTSGGTITLGDITITFPSGSFAETSEVNVEEVKSGQILGEDEESKFYQVTLPVDFRKEFTVSIKSDKKDENIAFIIHAPSVSPHHVSSSMSYSDIVIPSTYLNGAYTANIPSADNDGVTNTTNLTFGLAKALTYSSSASSRSVTRSEEDGNIIWEVCWFGWSWIVTNKATIDKINKEIDDAMNESVGIIKGLGFKVKGDRVIPINMCTFGMEDNEYGAHNQSCHNDALNVINLNRSLLTGSSYNAKSFRRTVIHELFHYFQSAYDPSGSAWEKCSLNEQPERLRIMEAGGVWIEKLIDTDKLYDGGWAPVFKDVLRGILDEGVGDNSSTPVGAFQTWGYGSSIVLDWFQLKKDEKQILKMYETWRDKKKSIFNSWISECEKTCGVEFFEKFSDFITTTAEGNLNAGIDWTILNPKQGAEKFTVKNFDAFPISLQSPGLEIWRDNVYHYGIKTLKVSLKNFVNADGEKSFKGIVLKISHLQDNIRAKVYKCIRNTTEVKLLGTVIKGSPMTISDEAVLSSLHDSADLYIIAEQITNSKQQEAFEISILAEEPKISTDPKTLAFEAKGGTEEVLVVTNQSNFKVKANDDWLEVKKKDNLTFEVTAQQNTGDARTGSVTVTALNNDNEEVGTYEMQVTQDERGKGAYDFTDLKYITIEVNTKVRYTGVWDGDQNDVFVVTKFPDDFNITPDYLAESPSTKTTVKNVGNGVHIECVCKTEESGEWMGVWNMSRDYQVTLDIDDVVSGKITNISAKCYWYNIHRADASVGGNVEESYNDETLSASNIPLPNKSGEAKGDQWTGTSINCSRSEHRGWTEYKYTTITSDEYSIIVKFHK